MKIRIITLMLAVVMIVCAVGVYAADIEYRSGVKIGEGFSSGNASSVTGSTYTESSCSIDGVQCSAFEAWIDLTIMMENNQTFTGWNVGVTSTSKSLSLPSSAPSPASYSKSNHRSVVKDSDGNQYQRAIQFKYT